MARLNWKISGAAGEGIKIAGLIFSQTAFKTGLFVHGYTEYPSLIRGGLNTFQVLAADRPVLSQESKFDLEISLADKTITQICQQNQLPLQTRNILALGISCFIFDLDLKTLNQEIEENFSKKGGAVVVSNQKAAQLGYDFAAKNYQAKKKPLPKNLQPHQKQILVNGNEALALGAVNGGMKFYCAYPMTPVTPILHFLAQKAQEFKIVVHHAEDEIGVINMALGASYAGVRSMVATSGGGFCLMTEGLGLSGVSATPVVIVLGMRPGPASGMPTWSSQGDLLFSINASQDEFPRIVLTPGNPQEAFRAAQLAQNLAEKYQVPVIILTDKNLGESYYTTDQFPSQRQNQRYLRHGVYLANSYEHDDDGFSTEDSGERSKQVDKRMKKLSSILADPDLILPKLYGPKIAKTTLISWGSNQGPILASLEKMSQTNFIHFPWVWPFPKKEFLALISAKARLVSIEANSSGQLAKLITQETGRQIKNQVLKYDGRPFYPDEIIKKLGQLE